MRHRCTPAPSSSAAGNHRRSASRHARQAPVSPATRAAPPGSAASQALALAATGRRRRAARTAGRALRLAPTEKRAYLAVAVAGGVSTSTACSAGCTGGAAGCEPVVSSPAPQSATDTAGRTSRTVARHGALGLAGAITAGAAGFALTVTVGRTLDEHATGIFFTCVAVFTILTTVLLLGADTGLVRELSALRGTGRREQAPVAFRVAARPVLALSVVVAAAGLLVAGPVARAAVPAGDAGELALALRVLAPFLVLSTASALLLNGRPAGSDRCARSR